MKHRDRSNLRGTLASEAERLLGEVITLYRETRRSKLLVFLFSLLGGFSVLSSSFRHWKLLCDWSGLRMRRVAIFLTAIVILSASVPSFAQNVFTCTGFNSSTSGACSVGEYPATGSQQIIERTSATSVPVVGTKWEFVPPDIGHASINGQYYAPVTISPGFTTTVAWVPNGQNFAFTVQNTNNVPGYQGIGLTVGAGCEGGFYQGDDGADNSPNNIWALQLGDVQDALNYTNYNTLANYGFSYSSVQMFQSYIDPCLPNQGGLSTGIEYVATNRISTYPVAEQATTTQFSTTGHVYVATMTYTGSNVTLQLYDQTLGNSCPGPKCFTYTWPVSIPPIVNGTTAFIGLSEGSNETLPGTTSINSWSYTALSPAATPTFSSSGGTYSGTQSVTISDSTSSSYICYNFTGAPATNGIGGCASGALYSGAISVPSGKTIYAVAGVSQGAADSAVASAAYNITGTGSTPSFYPGTAVYYNGDVYVTLAAAQGGVICYNTTGSPATNGSTGCSTGTKYTSPITVSSNETLYAVAGGTGLSDSSVGSVVYTINPFWDGSSPSGQAPANAPTFSPLPGTYSGAKTVTLSTIATGAKTPYICYTLDASPPKNLTPQTANNVEGTCAQGTLYTGPITVSSTQTIYAMAGTATGSLPSSLAQGTYTINTSTSGPPNAPINPQAVAEPN
jgi:hypothetical protein